MENWSDWFDWLDWLHRLNWLGLLHWLRGNGMNQCPQHCRDVACNVSLGQSMKYTINGLQGKPYMQAPVKQCQPISGNLFHTVPGGFIPTEARGSDLQYPLAIQIAFPHLDHRSSREPHTAVWLFFHPADPSVLCQTVFFF